MSRGSGIKPSSSCSSVERDALRVISGRGRNASIRRISLWQRERRLYPEGRDPAHASRDQAPLPTPTPRGSRAHVQYRPPHSLSPMSLLVFCFTSHLISLVLLNPTAYPIVHHYFLICIVVMSISLIHKRIGILSLK